MTETAYQQLESRFRRASLVNSASGLLHWDSSVMMPEGSAESRAEITATLNVLSHEMMTAPDMGDLLDAAGEQGNLTDWQQANLREMRRRWIHNTANEPALVEAITRAESACEMAWRQARPDNDYQSVVPKLQTLLDLELESARARAELLELEVYDALIDQFQPDARANEIQHLFDELAGFLPELADRAIDRQKSNPPLPLEGPFPVDRQKALGERFMQTLGFDFSKGRLDVSLHPFSGGTPDDQRITTRYDEADFTSSLMGVLHETGHALYEKQLPADWRHQPVGGARGMTVHESQSLLIEMQACRSREFLEFAAPLMREAFVDVTDTSGPAWQPDNLARLYTRVARSLIRVDADEVTYPAHVILRFRLEHAIVHGDLALADLPGAWNEAMQDLLGVTPPDDRLGCLQDIHWYTGAWGYFPTYTLGALAAAQIFDAATRAVPEILPGIAQGDFDPLRLWLAEHIHGRGSSLSTDDLIEEATGKPLGTGVFRRHLEKRYLDS